MKLLVCDFTKFNLIYCNTHTVKCYDQYTLTSHVVNSKVTIIVINIACEIIENNIRIVNKIQLNNIVSSIVCCDGEFDVYTLID